MYHVFIRKKHFEIDSFAALLYFFFEVNYSQNSISINEGSKPLFYYRFCTIKRCRQEGDIRFVDSFEMALPMPTL